MIFNSYEFVLFFLAFFILYWLVLGNNLKAQNLLLLFGGYVFYAWSDWRFLPYLIGISALNFYLGIYMEKTSNLRYKRWLLYAGLIQGVGGLVFFKYFNFFITSFKDAFQSLHININLYTLNIIIPLGISFFTFRTISYLLDIHKGKIQACKDWVIFFTYISFFPTVLSGPIDRAKNFIPQLEKKREFNYDEAMKAARQILYGLFKKVVIADSLAASVDGIFNTYKESSSIILAAGALFFSIQMYADFSGYSDMAIGISRLMGFNVTKNFDFPYFSQNIAEFWRKWHISLTSWLTEYIFTPLSIAFRDYGKLGLIFAIIINFLICGLWHGANWTYVFWGFLNGCYFIPLILTGNMNKKKKELQNWSLPTFRQFISIAGTFTLVTLTLVVFKSNTIGDAIGYFKGIFKFDISRPGEILFHRKLFILLILFFLTDYWISLKIKPFTISQPIKMAFFIFMGFLIIVSFGQKVSFIYFKF
jgi:D-alanyl-lipoteichoic acid acyltransferase DltB (MBOAT superfamily)